MAPRRPRTPARVPVADAWSIDDGFLDATGAWRDTRPETRAALVAAMGGEPGGAPPETVRPLVVRAGRARALDAPAEIRLEDGAVLRAEGEVPGDLPPGYHELHPLAGGPSRRLIVAPPACTLPADFWTWGWAVQLYAARSSRSWGIGDLADLRRLVDWAAGLGAGALMINPLNAPTPVTPQEPSPYCPSSRRFLSPLYLRIEEVPGAAEAGLDLEELARAGRRLDEDRSIDRDAVFRLKLEALERLWRRFGGHPEFDAFRAERGQALAEWAVFCALAERHGRRWREWPAGYRRPGSPAVARFAEDHARRVVFHAWIQWLLDRQLAAAGRRVRIVHDLPIGVDPDGADAWAWQDLLAFGASIGAPPDRYNAAGQDWGFPPFVPHRLAAAGYEPVVQTLRAVLRHAGGLRIDHVMGLFRLFWIPLGMAPAAGAYVRYPADDLLAVVALESHRAGAVIVGEDLGTVEAGVRERLAAERILSCRVLWFEREPPERYPELAMAAVTTHDLPTVRGLWTGADLRDQSAAGLQPNTRGWEVVRRRLGTMVGLPEDAPVEAVITETYRFLARAPSRLVVATLEDALAVEERPNMPGTTADRRPNWSRALPEPIEALERHPLAAAVAAALAGRRRPS